MKPNVENAVLLRQYLLGELPEGQLQQFEEKLADSEQQFEQLLLAEDELVAEYLHDGLSDQEKERFHTYFLSVPSRREKLRFAAAVREYANEHSPVPSRLQRLEAFIRGAFQSIRQPQPAIAFVLLFAVLAASYQGFHVYRTAWPIYRAEALLKQNYQIYMSDTPRLSGGYRSSGVSVLMAGEEPGEHPKSYLEQAHDLADQARSHGANPDKVRQLQAKIYLIQNNIGEAEQELNQMQPGAASAARLNDQGVLLIKKQDWQKSIQLFEAAVKIDPKFKEAWYNLALAWEKQGDSSKALDALEHLLAVETDEGWKNAALEFRKRLVAGQRR